MGASLLALAKSIYYFAISLFTDTAILSGYALLRCEIIRNESQAQSDCGSLCSVIARDYCADSLGVLLASS